MSGFWGAETEGVRRQASACTAAAGTVESLLATCTALIDGVEWVGPDAEAFRQRWSGDVGPRLEQVAQDLRAGGVELDRHAEEQDGASGGEGGGISIPGLPTLPLPRLPRIGLPDVPLPRIDPDDLLIGLPTWRTDCFPVPQGAPMSTGQGIIGDCLPGGPFFPGPLLKPGDIGVGSGEPPIICAPGDWDPFPRRPRIEWPPLIPPLTPPTIPVPPPIDTTPLPDPWPLPQPLPMPLPTPDPWPLPEPLPRPDVVRI
ncbi:WXG100 family type VII secretion target [Brachybacterium sp. AOP43-C2-M15]|uniref:WXG100 family type VII secretion target n=1 Tax=Brachybacterium sp. AOP43-C2-M15 TaxID=3457661 RepID=UPI0040337A96